MHCLKIKNYLKKIKTKPFHHVCRYWSLRETRSSCRRRTPRQDWGKSNCRFDTKPASLDDLSKRGITVRLFDFDNKATLIPALMGVERVLLLSGSAIGQRERQHRAAISTAKAAGVDFMAYTSVLHADTCPLGLDSEHRATEEDIKESGLDYAFLRHGWYTENTTTNAATDIARGMVQGSAADGRRSTAMRQDFAAANAAILLNSSIRNETFELAGDVGYTLSEYATALSSISGASVVYTDMPEREYKETLLRDGLPEHVASLLASASALCAKNMMFDEGRTLSSLIGRPTTSLRISIAQAVSQSGNTDTHIFQLGET